MHNSPLIASNSSFFVYSVDWKEWANQYKILTDYKDKDRFFWDEWKTMINTTQALVYKGLLDGLGRKGEKHLAQFIEIMKEQCYDKWYEWIKKKDFIHIMDIYFPVDEVETEDTKRSRLYWLFGMMLLTWWEWRVWFQDGDEMRMDEDWKLIFDNQKKWVSRSAMGLFANCRWIDRKDRDECHMSHLFGRSSRMMSS